MNEDVMPTSRAEAAESLIAVIETENRALAEQDFDITATIAPAKRAAIEALAAALEAPPATKPDDRRRMTALQTRLDAVVAANQTLLRGAIETQQSVVHVVLRALEDGRDASANVTYGPEPQQRASGPVAFVMRA